MLNEEIQDLSKRVIHAFIHAQDSLNKLFWHLTFAEKSVKAARLEFFWVTETPLRPLKN